MAAKFIVFSLLVASACGSGGYSSFSYGVADPNTGDIKDQHEKRVGDSVVGKYSLLESDGTKRIVEYEASAATGFNAIVRKEPAIGGQQSGPLGLGPLSLGPLPGSANQYLGPANQYLASVNQYVGPANQYLVPANQYVGSANQYLAPGNQYVGPANQYLGPANQYVGPVGQHVGPANQSVAPAPPSLSAAAQAAPIIPANATPIVPAVPPAPMGQLDQPSSLPLPVASPDLSSKPQPEMLPVSDALPNPGSPVQPTSQDPSGVLQVKGDLTALPGVAINQTPLVPSRAVSHQTVFAQHGFGQRNVLPYPEANGPQTYSTGIAGSRPLNPYLNPLSARPEYATFAGGNRLANPISGPQGVPAVSHFSNTILHVPRAYPGSQASVYNDAYGGPYGGAYRAYGKFGSQSQPGAFAAPLSHRPANFQSHGVGPYGVAHSYTSLTRGEAYPHGYGGYGARYNEVNSADIGAGLRW